MEDLDLDFLNCRITRGLGDDDDVGVCPCDIANVAPLAAWIGVAALNGVVMDWRHCESVDVWMCGCVVV